MSFQSLLHLGNESSLVRRLLCPRPTRQSQGAAHVLGRHFGKGVLIGSNLVSWSPTVVSGASTRLTSGTGATTTEPGHGLLGTLPFNEDEYVEVARVVGAHGVRGELRLELFTDEPGKRFKAGSRLYLLPPPGQGAGPASRSGGDALPLIAVNSCGVKLRPLGKGQEGCVVALTEVTSRTQAEQLRGHLVYCSASDRGALRDPDEFYVTDIIGCTVIDQASGRMVGLVVDVYSGMGTHDTLRVKLRANEEDIRQSRIRYCMIPFAKAICPVLDLDSRTLEVAPPEGLLDLVSEERLRKPLSAESKAQKLAQLRELQAKEALLPPPPAKEEDSDEDEDEEENYRKAVEAKGRSSTGASTRGTAARSAAPQSGRLRQAPRSQPRDGGVDAVVEARGEGRQGPGGEEVSSGSGQQEEEEGEGEDEEGGDGSQQGSGLRRRRPGLRRRPGSLRLGRRGD